MMKLGLAACAALALSATSASANGYWQDGVYYSYPTTTQTYTLPSNTVYDTVPTTTRTYVAPAQTYGTPTYSTPTYSAPTYTAPTYSAPVVYAPAPSYTVPSYTPPQAIYDGTRQVRQRLQNQRNRIERAQARGDLRRGEERRLREGLREIRRTFRAYRDNEGYIGRHEEAALMKMLNRNGQRIRRLANNDRVAGQRGHRGHSGPYAPYGY